MLVISWSVCSITRDWSNILDKCLAKVPECCTMCWIIWGHFVKDWAHIEHWNTSDGSGLEKSSPDLIFGFWSVLLLTAVIVFILLKENAWNFFNFPGILQFNTDVSKRLLSEKVGSNICCFSGVLASTTSPSHNCLSWNVEKNFFSIMYVGKKRRNIFKTFF